jgi:hypothetical protein
VLGIVAATISSRMLRHVPTAAVPGGRGSTGQPGFHSRQLDAEKTV